MMMMMTSKYKGNVDKNDSHKALKDKWKKPTSMNDAIWEYVDVKALSVILICISNDVFRDVVYMISSKGIGEVGVNMAKSITNLYILNSRWYDLQLQEGIKRHIDEFYSYNFGLKSIEFTNWR